MFFKADQQLFDYIKVLANLIFIKKSAKARLSTICTVFRKEIRGGVYKVFTSICLEIISQDPTKVPVLYGG